MNTNDPKIITSSHSTVTIWQNGNSLIIGGTVNPDEAFQIAQKITNFVYQSVPFDERVTPVKSTITAPKITIAERRKKLKAYIETYKNGRYALTIEMLADYLGDVSISTVKRDLKAIGLTAREFPK